jgi:hypothetical protein
MTQHAIKPIAAALLAGALLAGAAALVPAAPAGAAPAASAQAAATVTRAQAARIADRHIERRYKRSARAVRTEREDDFGSRWEVKVIRSDGAEFEVYVTARGKVVRVEREFSDD